MRWKKWYQPRGAGTELKRILKRFGIKERRGCGCKKYAAQMNVMGIEWCRANKGSILNRLRSTAKERKLPFSILVARRFVRKAIERSEKMLTMESVFDAVYCVNLKRREDRWKTFTEGVPNDWPFKPIERVFAIDGRNVPVPDWWKQGGGAWGCYRSHLKLIENALNTGLHSILLLEDDATFCEGFAEKATDFINALPEDWGLIYLGGQHLFINRMPPLKINNLVYRPFNVNRTHAFAIRGEAMMRKVYKHLNRQDWEKNNHIDHHLGRLHQRRTDPIYTPHEWLIGQASGKSNISGREAPERFWRTAADINQVDPSILPFVAVLGLHGSGSSCLAGLLHHLGLYLGDNLTGYYGNDPNRNCGFEAAGLMRICEQVIPFPSTDYALKRNKIWNKLRVFLNQKRRIAYGKDTIAAGKYPQLCQLGRQLINICEKNLYVVASDRPVEDSIESIIRRCPDKIPEELEAHQRWLLEGKEWLISQIPSERILRVDYYKMLEDTNFVIEEVKKLLNGLEAPFLLRDSEEKEQLIRRWVDKEKQHVKN